jgi:hypothetical protein
MKVTIKSLKNGNTEIYEFELQDGPGEVEHVKGYSTDLVNVFTKLLEWRERIKNDYRPLG